MSERRENGARDSGPHKDGASEGRETDGPGNISVDEPTDTSLDHEPDEFDEVQDRAADEPAGEGSDS